MSVAQPSSTTVDTRHEEDNRSEGEYAGVVIDQRIGSIDCVGIVAFFLFFAPFLFSPVNVSE